MCRIFGYDLSNSSVGCTRLTVHLEGMDWVGEDAEGESKLLQYFKRPAALAHLFYLPLSSFTHHATFPIHTPFPPCHRPSPWLTRT